MQTMRKKISVGTPDRLIVLPATMLINSSIDPINKIFPATIDITLGLPTLVIYENGSIKDLLFQLLFFDHVYARTSKGL